jgi:hypothetical protein
LENINLKNSVWSISAFGKIGFGGWHYAEAIAKIAQIAGLYFAWRISTFEKNSLENICL